MTSGVGEENPMKRRKSYKYESRDEALVARKKKRNRVRKERCRRARMHELAASGTKTPHKPFVVAIKRRSDGYIRNGLSPFGV